MGGIVGTSTTMLQTMTGFRFVRALVPQEWLLGSCFSQARKRQLSLQIVPISTIAPGQSWRARRQRAKRKSKSSFHQWLASSMCALEVLVLRALTQQGNGDVDVQHC